MQPLEVLASAPLHPNIFPSRLPMNYSSPGLRWEKRAARVRNEAVWKRTKCFCRSAMGVVCVCERVRRNALHAPQTRLALPTDRVREILLSWHVAINHMFLRWCFSFVAGMRWVSDETSNVRVCVRACVCVCEREREKERGGGDQMPPRG